MVRAELRAHVQEGSRQHAHLWAGLLDQVQASPAKRSVHAGAKKAIPYQLPFSQDADAHVYTKEDFERHQRTEWSGTEEAQAERLARCQDTLELLFRAAARADGDPPRQRLPGLMDSFMQWCESAREDFKLGPALDEQLGAAAIPRGDDAGVSGLAGDGTGQPGGAEGGGIRGRPEQGGQGTIAAGAGAGAAGGRRLVLGRLGRHFPSPYTYRRYHVSSSFATREGWKKAS